MNVPLGPATPFAIDLKQVCHGGRLRTLIDKPLTAPHQHLRCMMGLHVADRELWQCEEALKTVNLYGL
jgi:hypothetical protein